MPGDIKDHGTEIEDGRGEILLAQVFYAPCFFDLTGYRRPVVGGYIELFDNNILLTNRKVSKVRRQIVICYLSNPCFMGKGWI